MTDETEPAQARIDPVEEADPRASLEAVRKEKDELLSRLKYLQADFENHRKRAAKDSEAIVRFAHEALLGRLLPVLDEFDAALPRLEGTTADGLRMVRANLWKVLQEAGLQEIPAEGTVFDPFVHECVEQVVDPNLKNGTVREVVQKGYRLHERVLRPAHVIVVKNGGEGNG